MGGRAVHLLNVFFCYGTLVSTYDTWHNPSLILASPEQLLIVVRSSQLDWPAIIIICLFNEWKHLRLNISSVSPRGSLFASLIKIPTYCAQSNPPPITKSDITNYEIYNNIKYFHSVFFAHFDFHAWWFQNKWIMIYNINFFFVNLLLFSHSKSNRILRLNTRIPILRCDEKIVAVIRMECVSKNSKRIDWIGIHWCVISFLYSYAALLRMMDARRLLDTISYHLIELTMCSFENLSNEMLNKWQLHRQRSTWERPLISHFRTEKSHTVFTA